MVSALLSEAESECVVLQEKEPQGSLHCTITPEENHHVCIIEQGAAGEVQCAYFAFLTAAVVITGWKYKWGCELYIYTTLTLLLIIVLQVRSVPVRKDDEVTVVRGVYKKREGKVIACFRKKFVIHIERVTRENAHGEL